MRFFFDIAMLVVTTLIAYRSFVVVTGRRRWSMSDFCVLLLYFFQCLPVVADYVLGTPTYKSWFLGFEMAAGHEEVAIVYDLYVLALFVALFFVSSSNVRLGGATPSPVKVLQIPTGLLWTFLLLPYVIILFSGKASHYVIYASNAGRGLESSFTAILSAFLILSIISSQLLYFRAPSSRGRFILFLAYSFSLIWISGKRYIISTIVFSFFFLKVASPIAGKGKIKLKMGILLGIAAVLIYSAYYIANIKITTDGFWESTYAALRIDFGRDDVVKFTIWKEYFQEEHILEYPGQTILSTLFMAVPRSIYPSKPYPHYRYLTAALYNKTLLDIPAGMTPSVLEMFIANFRWFGIPVCILFLVWFCRQADKSVFLQEKVVYAFVLEGMLTQSLDAMLFVFYLWLYLVFRNAGLFRKPHRMVA
jgi:hypothetical protein